MKIATSVSPTEVHIDRSHMECSRRLLSKDDICVASYNIVTRTCMLYAYGCSPSFNVSNTGTWLIRRDLSGFIQENEDCSYYKNTNAPSGVFTIQPEGVNTGIEVYCDMSTDNGGWILIQNRYDGSVNFYQTWNQYKHGFGNLSGEFWIGNDNLHTLTYSNKYMLRVDLTDSFGNQTYAEYYIFRVSDEADKYRLIIGEYYGDAGDAMYYNNNQIFHTKDQDSTIGFNGRVCSLDRYAGFWFDRCTWANPNGRWLPDPKFVQDYQILLQNIFSVLESLHDDETNINTAWEMTRDSIVQSCEETVGYLQQNRKQWMSENTWKIVNERRQLKEKFLTAITRQQKKQTQEQYSNKIKRWKEHFVQVLNRPPPTDPPELQNGPTLNIKTSKITKAEVTKAIKSLKNGKAGGIDYIPPEAIKVLDVTSVLSLQQFCRQSTNCVDTSTDTVTTVPAPVPKSSENKTTPQNKSITLPIVTVGKTSRKCCICTTTKGPFVTMPEKARSRMFVTQGVLEPTCVICYPVHIDGKT
ncbi:Fibrinogen-like protein A,Ryncolin-4,Angiopoietin-related protein 7,Angiopoietin-related protein 1,Ficolin-1-B,Ficolin-2,Ryncolin-1,Fibrinogen-like protein 1,Ficolin-1,Tenascin-X,Tenascin-N,Ryncolin-3,Fibroleukin,Fibrinogen C domain-containing protein 1,Ryncolin-2,Techylectin-5B,Fibrinogen alpha chain,Ficolin-1-A,Tenascin,Angiopoietin-4 [Mytilus coruscus]|uniref:Fibrinogen C-terminal domain-containing protein n=1 Tax=Mytilus coruscus TaxID=42192 RepID=A0A6J8CBT1_MYTCO|nr:Fibrinogen-like protein A,Ryncolin-4,Angiopoietin-related protein 7,Angiopoietin-related protein 1,Ficolin-1-B,Ficolin-2,Ryncolin-1,Fibrinogen-like protein 1,Ficolin-1,Tenascin-X,Tenascin-N,Ryncolin-3,Fibroleukin,Fibrinogen C domain-containing protein 1,Ryncolin-2,Techylectin-5B,Fibrinogen alpha chain,Ficolin-1-A,Tenascin,Angiopoietin-4 [Mytilus coruscus]